MMQSGSYKGALEEALMAANGKGSEANSGRIRELSPGLKPRIVATNTRPLAESLPSGGICVHANYAYGGLWRKWVVLVAQICGP